MTSGPHCRGYARHECSVSTRPGRRKQDQAGAAVRSACCRGLGAALTLDDRVLAEDVISGREIDLAVLGRADGTRTVAPPLEIMGDGIFGYQDKYGGQADL